MTFALGFIAIATLVAIFAPRFVTPEELGPSLAYCSGFVLLVATLILLFAKTLLLNVERRQATD
jgi:branched-subunit amino acid transport protein